jgi:hypothetical protein
MTTSRNPSPADRVRRFLLLPLAAALLLGACARQGRIESAMRARPAQFSHIIENAADLRVQILISRVNEHAQGAPTLERHGFRVDAEYFYPASTIKVCAAIASLQILEDFEQSLGIHSLAHAPLRFAPLFEGDTWQILDPSNLAGGRITVAHEVRKLSLVSDNPAFNRLYDLCGHRDLNERMARAGLSSVVINHRLSDPRAIPDQRATAAITLFADTGPLEIPARRSDLALTNPGPGLHVGESYLQGGRLIEEPMDFTRRNGTSLIDLQDMLIMLVRPDIPLGNKRGISLRPDHRQLLIEAMTLPPRESSNPRYDASKYPDDYAKFLLPGLTRIGPPSRWRITNKVGRAYGFSVENACVHDLHTGELFFITAVLYTNADGVLNDDKYEYTQTADPFMADLAELVISEFASPAAGSPVRAAR